MKWESWQATVHGIAKSWTPRKQLQFPFLLLGLGSRTVVHLFGGVRVRGDTVQLGAEFGCFLECFLQLHFCLSVLFCLFYLYIVICEYLPLSSTLTLKKKKKSPGSSFPLLNSFIFMSFIWFFSSYLLFPDSEFYHNWILWTFLSFYGPFMYIGPSSDRSYPSFCFPSNVRLYQIRWYIVFQIIHLSKCR